MTPAERAKEIRDYWKKEYDFELMPSQIELLVINIEEAEREACKKFSKSCLCYNEGFRAAREKAAEKKEI